MGEAVFNVVVRKEGDGDDLLLKLLKFSSSNKSTMRQMTKQKNTDDSRKTVLSCSEKGRHCSGCTSGGPSAEYRTAV